MLFLCCEKKYPQRDHLQLAMQSCSNSLSQKSRPVAAKDEDTRVEEMAILQILVDES
jgi:hypothetical protein